MKQLQNIILMVLIPILPPWHIANHRYIYMHSHTVYTHTHTVPSRHTHLCLDEVIALGANVFEKAQDIHRSFILYLLEHAVDHNICACPPHSSTTERREEEKATNPNMIVTALQWPHSHSHYQSVKCSYYYFIFTFMFSLLISNCLENIQFMWILTCEFMTFCLRSQ